MCDYKHMSNEEVKAIAEEILNSIDNANNIVELDSLLTDVGM